MLDGLSPEYNRIIIMMAEFFGSTVLETLKVVNLFTGTRSFATNLPTNMHFYEQSENSVMSNNTQFGFRRL